MLSEARISQRGSVTFKERRDGRFVEIGVYTPEIIPDAGPSLRAVISRQAVPNAKWCVYLSHSSVPVYRGRNKTPAIGHAFDAAEKAYAEALASVRYAPKLLERWTKPDCYAGAAWPEHYRSGCGRSRDSDDLEESNFATMLEDLGGESDTVIVVRESHWAVGWVEWIAIHQDDRKALQIADRNQGRLADYPVLDENDWSEREQESASTVWRECFDVSERIAYIRKHPDQFDFNGWADMRDCVAGRYFSGYASALLT
jgi:hypothetical protein